MTITLTREEAQQVLDALNEYVSVVVSVNDPDSWTPKAADGGEPARKAIETLRTRLAQPEPEPVADKYLMEVECTKCGAKQDGILTVTAPTQREWQGLTDEEIMSLLPGAVRLPPGWVDTVRAIEAKLKEKNS
jgi:hypothetical protein